MRQLLVLLLLLVHGALARADLDDYVRRADASFAWTLDANDRSADGTHYHLSLVSQSWRGGEWKHRLSLFVPAGARTSHALLFIGGSGQARMREAALRLRAPVASLTDVPNQPLLDGLYEDDLIAETFLRYLRSGEEDWPLLLPMTKSAVRAMDALQALSRARLPQPIERFVLTGASKRGWTAWLAAAVDARVAGVAPRVIDMLNVAAQLPHQLRSWGGYSEMLSSYTQPGLPDLASTPPGRRLLALVDPYAYRDRLAMPKLILLGTNDRYWTLDALDLYWDGLSGEKRVLYVPNAEHGLDGGEHWPDALACFFEQVRAGRAMPEVDAAMSADAQAVHLRASGTPAPTGARLWQARAAQRDFREAAWSMQPMTRTADGYRASAARTPGDWTALFAVLDFDVDGTRCTLSTRVSLVPPEPRTLPARARDRQRERTNPP